MNYFRLVLIAALTVILVSSGMAKPAPLTHLLGLQPAPAGGKSPNVVHHVLNSNPTDHVDTVHSMTGLNKKPYGDYAAEEPAAEPAPADD